MFNYSFFNCCIRCWYIVACFSLLSAGITEVQHCTLLGCFTFFQFPVLCTYHWVIIYFFSLLIIFQFNFELLYTNNARKFQYDNTINAYSIPWTRSTLSLYSNFPPPLPHVFKESLVGFIMLFSYVCMQPASIFLTLNNHSFIPIISLFLSLAVVGFELRASCLVGSCSTT
jgi:hypothetical protein